MTSDAILRVLLFSPDIDGHRQVYCCVIADWFRQSGYDVILAVGRGPDGVLATETQLIGMLASRPGVKVLDLGLSDESQTVGEWVPMVRDLEQRYSPTWTVFPTGDEIRLLAKDLGVPSCNAIKRAAVFIRGDWLYKRDFSRYPHLMRPYRWARWQAHRLREMIALRWDIWGNLGLALAFHTNEDFPFKWMGSRFYHLPEIFSAWGFPENADSPLTQRLMDEYQAFLADHTDKQIILYYGGWQARRGYDVLLSLASETKDTVFVSVGRPTADNAFHYNIAELRAQLGAEGRLFEVEVPFLPKNGFVDFLYQSCDFVLLPYSDFYGLSGILQEAASFGKPVLVPDTGYMGSIVAKREIGMTYRHRDEVHFRQQFGVLRRAYTEYKEAATLFSKEFGLEKVHAALAKAFVGSSRSM